MKTKRLLSGLCALAMTFTAASQMGLTGIVTSADNELPIIPITSSKFEYTLLSDGTYEVSAYTGSGTSVTVPPRYNGKAVTSIGDSAFFYCMDITSVTLPSSITNIGYEAFNGCMELKTINIPSSVTTIGENAFKDCFKLESITLPDGITEIADGLFDSCMALSSVTIPDSVTRIGVSAFAVCTSLKAVEIPSGVTEIAENAFFDCSSLSEVTIPDTVTSIGDRAFVECKSLKAVTIPKSVTEIGEQAFGYYTEGSPDAVYKKVSGFTVTGYKGSAAETYAKDNGFTFTALEEDSTVTIGLKLVAVPDVTDSIFISISVDGKHEATAQGTEIPFKLAEGTHEMTFSAPGFVTRTYTVTVTDGKLTEALTAELRRPGDADANGKVDMNDIIKIKRHLINVQKLTDYDLEVADVDGNEGLNVLDITRIKQHLIGINKLW